MSINNFKFTVATEGLGRWILTESDEAFQNVVSCDEEASVMIDDYSDQVRSLLVTGLASGVFLHALSGDEFHNFFGPNTSERWCTLQVHDDQDTLLFNRRVRVLTEPTGERVVTKVNVSDLLDGVSHITPDELEVDESARDPEVEAAMLKVFPHKNVQQEAWATMPKADKRNLIAVTAAGMMLAVAHFKMAGMSASDD